MTAVSYISPDVNPNNIHHYVTLGIRFNPEEEPRQAAREGEAERRQQGEGQGPEITVRFQVQRSSYARSITNKG